MALYAPSDDRDLPPIEDSGRIPMSFPAILRHPGLSDRHTHLYSPSSTSVPGVAKPYKKTKRNDNEGKRWVRRRDNARFTDNPHIVPATKKDLAQPLSPAPRTTFPVPLPPFLPRTQSAPAASSPVIDNASTAAGQFSMSRKGMRRELRRSGPRAAAIIRDVEDEMEAWLAGEVSIWSNPDGSIHAGKVDAREIGTSGSLIELERTPLRMVWTTAIDEDGFARYVVHCTARYHDVVSFSKDDAVFPGQRVTHLLRPQQPLKQTRQGRSAAIGGLDTPPTTDFELSSVLSDLDIDSEMASELASQPSEASNVEAEAAGRPTNRKALSEIDGDVRSVSEAAWSIVGGSDGGVEADGSGSELGEDIAALSLDDGEPIRSAVDTTPRALPPLRTRSAAWTSHARRSASSPSRSPARRQVRVSLRGSTAVVDAHNHLRTPRSFYDYVFS